MNIQNNTHYFTHSTKTINCVSEMDSFKYESSRRQSFMQRLYFEYLDVQRKGGSVYFYTLTYNDKAMPYYEGRSCFSYKDIRYVTNGALSKWLLRSHHCKLRYLCACERGEGKGKRGLDSFGLGNNPHYHFIFFLHPLDGCVLPDPRQFQSKINQIWQGSDSSFVNWKTAKFGHSQPGDNLGLVTSSDAFSYVCKYVCKDAAERDFEFLLSQKYYKECFDKGITNAVIYSLYRFLRQTDSRFRSKYDFFESFYLHTFYDWRKRQIGDFSLFDFYKSYLPLNRNGNKRGCHLIKMITDYFKDYYVLAYVDACLCEYRRDYSGKVRCSKSLGEYGLQFLKDTPSGVKVTLPCSKGYKTLPACLYYIRKKFYNVFKCPVSGNVLYRLNEDGISYKCNHLKSSIDSLTNKIAEYYSCASDIVIPDFLTRLTELDHRSDISSIVYRFCVYKLVYQYRHYVTFDNISLDDYCSLSSVLLDYRRFLSDSAYVIDYDDNTIGFYLQSFRDDLLSFDTHPAFMDYLSHFKLLDEFLDLCSTFFDSQRKVRFKERSDFQKKHNSVKFNLL